MQVGDIIICKEDFDVFDIHRFFYYKDAKYQLGLPMKAADPRGNMNNSWHIVRIDEHNRPSKNISDNGWFSEEELYKFFDCITYLRFKKLKKINENSNL